MTIEELKAYSQKEQLLKGAMLRLQELEERRNQLKSVRITDMPKGSGGTESPVEMLAIDIADTRQEVVRLAVEAQRLRRKTEKFINGIEDVTTRMLFEYKFIHCFSWSRTAYEANYSKAGAFEHVKKYLENSERIERS